MRDKLQAILKSAEEEIKIITSSEQLDEFRVKYLGKKGVLKEILKGMGKVSNEERPLIGKIANETREKIEKHIESMKERMKSIELENRLLKEDIDVTLP
ncbi:MAG: phenylalanine--tRNA ligase subunit alpha, partial [Clostridiales bacterium]|nr:phenylalanine--tRNA ligase subunit alpha [Clostridiales bacterium]